MTPDELARVPSGGATWKQIKFGTQVHLNGKWLCDCGYNDKDARQIVGSVNAAIIANNGRKKAKEIVSTGQYEEHKNEYLFWLNYAKGNA